MPGPAILFPEPTSKELTYGFRVLTDYLIQEDREFLRIDIMSDKMNQEAIGLNCTSKKPILTMPKGMSGFSVNVEKQELIENLEKLLTELKKG